MSLSTAYINIKEIHIKNFRGYGENPLNKNGYFSFYDLDKDIVVFNGYNGHGKTSFFEAIEWCLTDKIQRLKVLNDVYQNSFIKKSHYLKFFSAADSEEKRENRVISVIIVFDNGFIIRRETKNSFLKATPGDKYSSKLDFIVNGKNYENRSQKDISKLIFRRTIPSNDFNLLNINLLGQESMNEFIRSTKSTDRKKTLMQLLNFEHIQSIIEKSEKVVNSKALVNRENENNTLITSYTSYVKKLNEIFAKSGLVNLEQYFNSLNLKLGELKNCANLVKDSNLQGINNIVSFDINNCMSQIRTLKIIQHNLLNCLKVEKENELRLKESKEKLEIIKLINQIVTSNNKMLALNIIKEIDNEQILKLKADKQSEVSKLKIRTDKFRDLTENINSLLKELTLKSNNGLPEDFTKTFKDSINFEKVQIDKDFWDALYSKLDYFKVIFDKYKIYIKADNTDAQLLRKELNNKDALVGICNKYMTLNSTIESVRNEILTTNNVLNSIKKKNSEQVKLLEDVKKYIIKTDDINACPICQNNDFSIEKYKYLNLKYVQGKSVSESLLNIINFTISSGNEYIEMVLKELTAKMKNEEQLKKQTIDDVFKPLSSQLVLIYNALTNVLIDARKFLNQELTNMDSIIKNFDKEIIDAEETLKRFTESYNLVFETSNINQDYKQDNYLDEKLNFFKEQLTSCSNQLNERLKTPVSPTMEELVNLYNKFITEYQLDKYYPSNQGLLERDLSVMASKLAQLDKLKSLFEDIIKLELPQEYENEFKNLMNNERKAREAYLELQKIRSLKINAGLMLENSKALEEKLFNNLSTNSTLIEWIYKQINPHPFYRDLRIVLDGQGGILLKGSDSNVIYDQIFSAAQLNILALSIFLGLGIPQDYTKLGQLLIDDPIQSMDDANTLALIDVLRAILDSNCKRKLIISTHDDDFAQLLSIKMRNKNFVQYTFEGYGKEGPRYTRIYS